MERELLERELVWALKMKIGVNEYSPHTMVEAAHQHALKSADVSSVHHLLKGQKAQAWYANHCCMTCSSHLPM